MNWIEISVLTSHEATEAIANLFHEVGAGGVVIEDPLLINNLRKNASWELCDIPEPDDIDTVTVQAYLPNDKNFTAKMEEIENGLAIIEGRLVGCRRANTFIRQVADEDWANSWKQYFFVSKIGENIVIKPTWQEHTASENEIIIEIDPGMAFGTGTHHTTSLCIKVLENIVPAGCTIFDLGTGSGILSIVAAKLGAGKILAVDIDSVAVKVAKENVLLNKVENIVAVQEGDLLTGIKGNADIIVANIIADIIIKLCPHIPARLNPDGLFLASGIIMERLQEVLDAAAKVGLNATKVTEQCGWAVVEFRK